MVRIGKPESAARQVGTTHFLKDVVNALSVPAKLVTGTYQTQLLDSNKDKKIY